MTMMELKALADAAVDRWRQRVLQWVSLHTLNLYMFAGVYVLGWFFIYFFDPSYFALKFYVSGIILIMGVYLVFCFLFMRQVAGAEDYVYYMGFLFTLTGLALSLFKVSETRKTEIIISYFGFAVISTIIGVGYRVLLIMAHRDPESAMQVELAEAVESAHDLNQELKAANSAFSRLRKQSEKAVADLAARMVTGTEDMSQQLQAILKNLSEQSARQMDEATRTLAGATQIIQGELQTILSNLSEQSARQMNEATRTLAGATEIVQRDLQTTSVLMREQMADHARQFSEGMRTTADAVPQQIQAAFGRVSEEMEATARRVAENVVAAAESLPNDLKAISARLGQETERNFGEVTRQMTAVAQSLSHELQNVYDELRRQTQRQADQLADAMTAQTEPLSKGLRDIADQMAGTGKGIRDEGRSVVQGLEQLNTAVAAARASLEQLRHPGKLVEVQFAPLSASLEGTVESLKQVIDSHARQMREIEKAIAAWHLEEKSSSGHAPVTMDAVIGALKTERRRSWWRRLFASLSPFS
jgi:hypothetical protein